LLSTVLIWGKLHNRPVPSSTVVSDAEREAHASLEEEEMEVEEVEEIEEFKSPEGEEEFPFSIPRGQVLEDVYATTEDGVGD
jgi:hypothetical protein